MMKVFVVTHQETSYDLPANYEYMLGGNFKKEQEIELGFKSHEFFEQNIAHKNKYYSELSSLFMINQLILQNKLDEEFIGLVHYRRFFLDPCGLNMKCKFKKLLMWKLTYSDIYSRILSDKVFEKLNAVIYVAKREIFDITVREQYYKVHGANDLEVAIECLLESHPNYHSAVDLVLNRKYLFCFNMFIAKKRVVNDYCQWLFPILDIIENKIDLSIKVGYQTRVLGYLSERLFNVWLQHNYAKDIVELPVAKILNAK